MNSYAEFVSIRPGGNGDITDTHTNWKERVKLSVSSPVYNDGHIFIASDDRFVACFNIKEGGRPKTARFQPKNKGIYASPIVAGGRLYIVSIWDGAYVFSATPDLKLIAHNKIEGDDTDFNASPVPHKGQLLLRSNKFLYCIGK
jgi:hypothetical protein